MIPQQWEMVKDVFEQAAQLDESRRADWLQSQSLPAELMVEVRRLLDHLDSGDELENPDLAKPLSPASPRLCAGVQLLNRFEIRSFIGRGGMGEVYAAHDRELDQLVALKMIKTEFAADPRWIAQLRHELRNARRVRHENVCRLFDIHRTEIGAESCTFITMELLEGNTLAVELSRGVLEWNTARQIATGVIAGLRAVHDAGIVHRDLKNANVFLIRDPILRAVIMDFGLSRVEQPSVWETVSIFGPEAMVGTPAYMAPEQLRGEPATIRSDLHALGVVLFEMATGRLPFPGKTPLATALQRLEQEAPSVRGLRPDVPPGWERAIHSCLARDPARRPREALDVLALLDQDSRPKRPFRLPRRAWIGAVLSGTGFAGWAAATYFRPAKISPQAVFHFQRAEELARKLDQENTQAAIGEYTQAIRIFPDYADAWLGLARSYASATHYTFIEPKLARAKADEAAVQVLKIRPRSGDGYGVRAFVLSTDFDRWREAEPMLTRAIRLNPSSSELHCWYAVFLGRLGRHQEAVEEARTAVSLNSGDYESNHQVVVELTRARRFGEAVIQARELVRLRSTEPEPYAALGRAYEWTGDYENATRALDDAERYSRSERNRYTALAHRVTLLAARGSLAEARTLAAQVYAYWKANAFESNLLLSAYGKLNDKAKVVEVLESGYQRGDTTILAAFTNPYLLAMRQNPELQVIFKRLKFIS